MSKSIYYYYEAYEENEYSDSFIDNNNILKIKKVNNNYSIFVKTKEGADDYQNLTKDSVNLKECIKFKTNTNEYNIYIMFDNIVITTEENDKIVLKGKKLDNQKIRMCY